MPVNLSTPAELEMRGAELTERQQEVLEHIRKHVRKWGVPPSRTDLARTLELVSGSAVAYHLQALERKGWIQLNPGMDRGIQLLREGTPVFDPDRLPEVAAGTPILADESKAVMRVPDELSRQIHPQADFYVVVRGDSMSSVGYRTGDIIAIKRTPDAAEGNVVMARIGTEITLKCFHRPADDRVELKPCSSNPEHRPIVIDERTEDWNRRRGRRRDGRTAATGSSRTVNPGAEPYLLSSASSRRRPFDARPRRQRPLRAGDPRSARRRRDDTASHPSAAAPERCGHVRVVVAAGMDHQRTTHNVAHPDSPRHDRNGRATAAVDRQSRQVPKMAVAIRAFVTPRVRRIVVPAGVLPRHPAIRIHMNVEAVLAGRQPAEIRGEAGTFGRVLDENGTEPHARVGRVDVHCQRGHLR